MKSKNKAVTLIELIVTILLLSVVVLTAVTLELAVRRMQIRPAAEAKLIDELIPVLERIEKDFQAQIGTEDNPGVSIENSDKRLVIRVDYDNDSKISNSDKWHRYEWNSANYQMGFCEDNSSCSSYDEVIAYGISTFNIAANNYALNITIGTRKDPAKYEDLFSNPAVNLTTTVFSRMASSN